MAAAIVAGIVLLGAQGGVGSAVLLGWMIAVLVWWFGWVGGRAGRVHLVAEVAAWPLRTLIEAVVVGVQLAVPPRQRVEVSLLGVLWEAHPKRVERLIRRTRREVLRYAATERHAAGFCAAVAARLTDGSWSYLDEAAAWDALSVCHDPTLLARGIERVVAWEGHQDTWSDSAQQRRAGVAGVELARNPVVELTHVLALGAGVRDTVWYVLEPIWRAQSRSLIAGSVLDGLSHTEVQELGRLVERRSGSGRPGAGSPAAATETFAGLLAVIAEAGSGRPWFARVLLAVLTEDEAAGRWGVLGDAQTRIDALEDGETVAQLLAAGAAGTVEELDAVARG